MVMVASVTPTCRWAVAVVPGALAPALGWVTPEPVVVAAPVVPAVVVLLSDPPPPPALTPPPPLASKPGAVIPPGAGAARLAPARPDWRLALGTVVPHAADSRTAATTATADG